MWQHVCNTKYIVIYLDDTLLLLKTCRKGTRMNCWETLYMQVFHQNNILITEQQIGGSNPLYELANTKQILPRDKATSRQQH